MEVKNNQTSVQVITGEIEKKLLAINWNYVGVIAGVFSIFVALHNIQTYVSDLKKKRVS